MRACKVYINQNYCGLLTEEDDGHFVFVYDENYRKEALEPVCISMPLTKPRYENSSLFPFFTNLLSEGTNRAFKARINGVDPDDDFGLLLKTAGYDTIGSVTVLPV